MRPPSPRGRNCSRPGDYTIDEKQKQAHLTEEGHEKVEKLFARAGILADGESLYDASNIRLMHHLTAALRAHGLFKRDVDYIVKRRRGDHRRRVHGPHDGRPALVRRPAPGRRGEGRRAGERGEPDGRLDHVPELLPHVRQARGHDRHRGHRGVRVPADLRPRGRRDPDAQGDDPRRRAGSRLPHRRTTSSTRSSRTSRTATSAVSPCSSARRRSRPRSSCRDS